jgi:group I intron endonuclease
MFVYKMTNTVNGKSYVGATIRPIKTRLQDHANAARRGRTTLIAQAIREVGIAAFVTQILHTVDSGSYDDLMAMEIEAIREHGTLEPSGYNRTTGGLGTPDCRMLESTKLKIGATSKGRIPSADSRAKMSLARKGKPCWWMKGRRTGQPAWNRGMKHTEEARKKMSESRTGGKNWKARPIEFQGVEYSSISDAVRATGLSKMQISYRLAKGDAACYVEKKEKGKTSHEIDN